MLSPHRDIDRGEDMQVSSGVSSPVVRGASEGVDDTVTGYGTDVTTLVARLPVRGGGNCSSHRDCYAGLCCRGACACAAGYVGLQCEFEVRCSQADASSEERWRSDACKMSRADEGGLSAPQWSVAAFTRGAGTYRGDGAESTPWVRCSCRASRDTAVTVHWQHRCTPWWK